MQEQLATKIDRKVKRAVDSLCKLRGYKMNRFVEEALIDKLEELIDIKDLRSLRTESSRPLEAVIKDLEAHGKL